MITRYQLNTYLQELLNVNSIPDYCPNGLQVEGKPDIHKIVTGVTANLALLKAAIIAKADAIIVHHGYFWKSEEQAIVGIKRKRIQTLLENEMSLFAYHLPLDVHQPLGNNAQLAKLLNLTIEKTLTIDNIPDLLFIGKFKQPITSIEFSSQIKAALGRNPLAIADENIQMKTIAWCTGAAQRYIELAAKEGVDAYLTGEVSEPTVHIARETHTNFFAAGHHATERYGVKALGDHVAEAFGIAHEFIDIDNPV